MQSSLSVEEFNKFCFFFYRKTGIYFDQSKRYFVDRRLLQRMKAVHAESFRDYFNRLDFQSTTGEMQQLINSMTVNESYFFREDYQFKCLVQSILPEIIARKKQNKLRIWSIPCASGEEPYSLAIYLLEYGQRMQNTVVELYASDINSHIVEKAKQGIYQPRSLVNVPLMLRQKYFTALNEETYQIHEKLRNRVTFSCVNLMDVRQMQQQRLFDVIFCRNLLIYFDNDSRSHAAEHLYHALLPGGYICLGHAEFMNRISQLFSMRCFPEATVYQKPV